MNNKRHLSLSKVKSMVKVGEKCGLACIHGVYLIRCTCRKVK